MSTVGQCAAFCAGGPEFDHRCDHNRILFSTLLSFQFSFN